MEKMNDPAVTPHEMAEIAKARAAFIAFLNLHFSTLPDVSFVKRVRNGELSSVLEILLKDPSMEGDLAAGASLMASYLEKTRQMDLDKLSDDLGVDRTRLYRGVAKGYGPPPPYELEWSKTTNYEVLENIVKTYHQMGLSQSPETRERLDYIGIELDFVRELAEREAAAWEGGEIAEAVKLLAAQEDFVREHVGAWVPSFIEKAMDYVETDFYKGHMFMLRGFLAASQEELGLS